MGDSPEDRSGADDVVALVLEAAREQVSEKGAVGVVGSKHPARTAGYFGLSVAAGYCR